MIVSTEHVRAIAFYRYLILGLVCKSYCSYSFISHPYDYSGAFYTEHPFISYECIANLATELSSLGLIAAHFMSEKQYGAYI